MKTVISIITSLFVLSSCTGNKFLSRKYTAGVYTESHRSIKHNTIKLENNNIYASMNSTLDLKKSNIISEVQTEKEIIETKANSIIKRDSIIQIPKKGKDEIIVIKNNLPDVYVKVNPKTRERTLISKNKIPVKNTESIERELRIRTMVGLLVFFMPVMGILIAAQTKKRIKKYKEQNPNINYRRYKKLANLGLALNILPSLAFCLAALALAAFIIALCFSASGFFSVALF